MKKTTPNKKKNSKLQKLAKGKLAKQKERTRELSVIELNKLLRELGTRQIELEIQNEDLRQAQAEIDISRRKYADLYDFSPVGYFSFDKNGLIQELNHTGAGMLGLQKRSLIAKPFLNYIDPVSRTVFLGHLAEVFRSQIRQTCEVIIKTKNGVLVPVQLQSIVADSGAGIMDSCRTAVGDISELKRTERALEESMQREHDLAKGLSAILDAIPTPVIIVHDPDSTHMTGNRAADELLKHPRGAEVSLSAPPEIKPRHFRAMKNGRELRIDELPAQRAARGEHVTDYDFSLVFDDGSTRHLLGYGTPLLDEQGHPRGAVHVLVDITDRKQAEEALRTSEQRLMLFIEHAPASLAMFDRDMRYLRVSRRWQSDYGLGDRNLCGLSHYEVFPEIPEKWKEVHRRGLAGEVLREEAERFERADGSIQWVRWEVLPWYTSAETVGGIVIFTEDITEDKLAEESLLKAKELSDALNRINKAVHSTFVIEEIMHRVITEAATAVGSDSAAMSLRDGDNWVVRYVHGMPQEVVGTLMTDGEEPHAMLALETGKPVLINDAYRDERVNTAHMKKLGIRAVMVVPLIAGEQKMGVMFFNYHGGTVLFSNAQNDFANKLASTITLAIDNARLLDAWKRAEEKVRHLNDELKSSYFELEAVNIELETFSYSVAHDLRAPLRIIEGFSTAIIEDYATNLDGTGKDYFNRIVAASRRMSQLIDAMLHMARLTRSEIRDQVVNMSSFAQVIASELKRGNPERQVEFIIARDVKARGDADMLHIVLENLLDNAFKFTGRHQSAKIEFGSMVMEGRTVYFVRDDGAGFDTQYAGSLFKPFKRLHTESEFPGIGIGLATANSIISRHNGRLWVESNVEKGATFYFTLTQNAI